MVKFFLLAGARPTYGVPVLVVVTAYGLVVTEMSPGELDSGLGILLLVQMFLASSGFVATARRGHYDQLLVQGNRRTQVVRAEWLAAIAPGVAAWIVLAAAGWGLGSAASWSALAGSRLVALFIVSCVSWSVGFALPRGAAGVLWIAVLVTLLLRHVELVVPALGGTASPAAVIRNASAVLLCPFLLIGSRPTSPLALTIACGAAATVLAATWRYGARLDVRLLEQS